MEISTEALDKVIVVRLEGNLDTNTSTEAQNYLNKAGRTKDAPNAGIPKELD
jgi:anti-anti-sigma regulatory factor